VHAGLQRSTNESGRHITLDGDELCARGRGSVCAICVCVCVRYCEKSNIWREMCVYVMESYMLNRVFMKRLCVRYRERCAGLEVGRGRLRVSKCVH